MIKLVEVIKPYNKREREREREKKVKKFRLIRPTIRFMGI